MAFGLEEQARLLTHLRLETDRVAHLARMRGRRRDRDRDRDRARVRVRIGGRVRVRVQAAHRAAHGLATLRSDALCEGDGGDAPVIGN